jgi:hypothetical protein
MSPGPMNGLLQAVAILYLMFFGRFPKRRDSLFGSLRRARKWAIANQVECCEIQRGRLVA